MYSSSEAKLQLPLSFGGTGTNNHHYPPQLHKVKILGCNISRLSPLQQFLICSAGVFFFFLLYGYFQVGYLVTICLWFKASTSQFWCFKELMFIQPSIKSHGLFLTFYQFVLFSIFAWIECYVEGIKEKKWISIIY